MKKSCLLIVSVILLLLMCSPVALASGHADLGSMLPLWSIIPFVGMLLSIAIFPLVKPHWWEHHQGLVVIIWSVVFLVPFAIGYGVDIALEQLLEIIIGDYLTFVVLLLGLFVVSGNIVLRGNLVGAPRLNLFFLLIGSLLASWIGTTGASMLMIRPMLQANQWRKNKVHIFIFFIFMISNIGGSLTPVGDPPLFLGFLRGVPFFWTMRLFPIMILNLAILSVVFFLMDRHFYRKELAAGNHPPILVGEVKKDEGLLRLSGKHNFIFMAAIVGSVILSGFLPQFDAFADQATGALKGLHVYGEVTLPYTYVIQVVIILLAAFLSYKTSKPEDREYNHFTWAPIKEVAILFIGIFITMIPALAILKSNGASLGLTEPAQFFWITGALSSFLDNAPTYLVFLTTAGTLGAQAGVATTVGIIDPTMLMAITSGAVFMGAMTYIGNAPNFMVRTIAEENNVKMPSFFGYILWSACILLPIFAIDTLVFFL